MVSHKDSGKPYSKEQTVDENMAEAHTHQKIAYRCSFVGGTVTRYSGRQGGNLQGFRVQHHVSECEVLEVPLLQRGSDPLLGGEQHGLL